VSNLNEISSSSSIKVEKSSKSNKVSPLSIIPKTTDQLEQLTLANDKLTEALLSLLNVVETDKYTRTWWGKERAVIHQIVDQYGSGGSYVQQTKKEKET